MLSRGPVLVFILKYSYNISINVYKINPDWCSYIDTFQFRSDDVCYLPGYRQTHEEILSNKENICRMKIFRWMSAEKVGDLSLTRV